MALKPCRECEKKVSTEALACPNCGVPNPVKKISKKKYKVTPKYTDSGLDNIYRGVISEEKLAGHTKTMNTIKVYCLNENCELGFKIQFAKNNLIGKIRCKECKQHVNSYNYKSMKEDERLIKNKSNYISQKKKIDNYYKKKEEILYNFWTGSEGLAKTFWLYFIFGNMVANLLILIAADEGAGMVNFVLIIALIWNIFAILGVFRAADIYKAEKIQQGETYGYATAAKIAVVLLILSGIGNAL